MKKPRKSSYFAVGAEAPLESVSEVVAAVVAFANGDTTPPVETRFRYDPFDYETEERKPCLMIPDGETHEDMDGRTISLPSYHPISMTEAKRIAAAEIIAEQTEALDWLNRVLRSHEKIEVRHALREIYVSTPRSSWGQSDDVAVNMGMVIRSEDDGTIDVTFCAAGPSNSHKHWTLFAAAALAANHGGIRDSYSYCQLPACGKVFSIETSTGRGRKRRKYCSKQCLDRAHDASATERVKRSRERKRLAAKQKPTRRRK
jgi:hypothetical protein